MNKGIAAKCSFLHRGACLLSDYKIRLDGEPDTTIQQWRCCVFSRNLYFYYTFLKTEVWGQAWFLIPRVDSTCNPFRCFIPFFLFDTWIFFLHRKAVFVLTLMSKSAKRDYVWSKTENHILACFLDVMGGELLSSASPCFLHISFVLFLFELI